MTASYSDPDSLVSTEWLAGHIDDDSVRIFECTTYLRYLEDTSNAPYRVESGRADYDLGHIPNAAFLDLQRDFSDNDAPPHLRFRMLALPELAQRFAQAGIGDGRRVVLYSRGAPQWASRFWWMLRAVGFDNAALLDGGFEKWQQEQRPLSTDAVRFAAAKFTAKPRPELFVDAKQVLKATQDATATVINALAADLHSGANARYGRAGRIPGSCNVPAASLINTDDGTFVDAPAAASQLEAVGASPERPTILYCGGGIAATLDAFVMHRLGFNQLTVYDASMSEWARDPALPIETD